MAYINATEVKRIRETLKAALPDFKFSVRKGSGGLSVDVAIMAGPIDLSADCYHGEGYGQLNHYYLEDTANPELYEAIQKIIKLAPTRKYYNNSDSSVDYFDVAYYYHIHVGAWNKPYEIKVPKKLKQQGSYTESTDAALAFNELAA